MEHLVADDAPMTPRASVRFLPLDLEAHLIERVQARAPRSTVDECIARLARPAAALTTMFTSDRPEQFPDYTKDEDTLLAYALLFFPQTWTRVRFALAEAIDVRGFEVPKDRPARVLDLGAGLGAAGLSAAELLIARGGAPSVELTAIDRSPAALDSLRAFAALGLESLRGIALSTATGDLAHPSNATIRRGAPYDLILASFSLNEAFSARDDADATRWFRDLAALVTSTGRIVIVEPALRATAERLRRVVAPVIAEGVLHVHGPDLHDALAPPPEDERFRDHEVRRWTQPHSLTRLNSRLQLSLNELTFTSLTLSPAPPRPLESDVARLTSPIVRLKGRWVFTGLGADGARHNYEILDRGIDADGAARLRDFERGDLFATPTATDIGQPVKRRLPDAAGLVSRWRPT